MLIPCRKIGASIQERLAEDVQSLKKQGKQPHLSTILVGSASEQLSFVAIKRKKAEELGISFKFIHLPEEPMYEEFARLLQQEANDPKVSGMIVQLPLPITLRSDSLYSCIPIQKEIEGHRIKSPFLPPIGLATLTALKYTFTQSLAYDDVIVTADDKSFFHANLKSKRVVLLGRGITGGIPLGKTLSAMHVPYINIASGTDPSTSTEFIRSADIIISAVGKQVLHANQIKPGAILLNVGLRQENGKLRGDYDETEMAPIASAYTRTPGGIGPIDVLYLFRNLVDAAKMQ